MLIERETTESKVKAIIPYCKPLKVEACEKCETIIAEPKELIKTMKEREEVIKCQ